MTEIEFHPRTHALLVGIDAYGAGVSPLHGCVNDIDVVQRLLVDRLGVAPGDVIRLASPHEGSAHETDVPSAPATRAALASAFERLGGESVRAADKVFIYYSGHGTSVLAASDGVTTRREALVPVDAVVVDGCATGLLYDVELNRLLSRVMARTRQVTFILDCCHSGGATRDLAAAPGDRERAIRVDRAVGPAAAADEATRAIGVTSAGTVGDCLVVAACLADEKALECADKRGNKHGLLTQTLVNALAATPAEALATLSWGHIWRQVVGEVERRRPQHPTLTGSYARPVFGGPPREGDSGLGVKRSGETYTLDAGELAGVTVGAVLAVYGSTPDRFPRLGTDEDHGARKGLLKVTAAERSSASAVAAEGTPFDLPQGARGRVVEAGETAKLRVGVIPSDPRLEALVNASKLLKVVPAGETSAAQLERDARGVLWMTDAVHGTDEARPYLAKIPEDQTGKAVELLQQYARYSAPLRMSELCVDLPGALEMEFLDCDGKDVVDGEYTGKDPQNPELPALLPGPDGVYDLNDEDQLCIRVTNTSNEKLRVTLFDCVTDGYAEKLGDTQSGMEPHSSHVFWTARVGEALQMFLQADRKASLDRFVAIGTSAVEKDLSGLATPKDETFAAILEPTRGSRAAGKNKYAEPPTEHWTAVRATIRLRAGGSAA